MAAARSLTAATRLEQPGSAAGITFVTSLGLLRRAVRARQGHSRLSRGIPGQIVPADRAALPVTMPGGHPHTPTASRPPPTTSRLWAITLRDRYALTGGNYKIADTRPPRRT